MKSLDEDGYKYLEIIEIGDVKHREMKELIREYFRRVRKILNSKLIAANFIQAITTRAISLIRYVARIVY